MMKFWNRKKEEVKDGNDISLDTILELENGLSLSIKEIVNAVEAKQKKSALSELEDKTIKVNGKDITIKDLIAAYNNAVKDDDEEDDDDDIEENEDDEDKDEEKKDKKKNKKNKKKNADDDEADDEADEDADDDIAENEDEDEDKDKEKKDKKNSKENFEKLDKADKSFSNAKFKGGIIVDTVDRQVSRGADRYGSENK